MMPERFADGCESRQDTLGALHIYIAGFVINGRAGSGVAEIDCIAEKIVITLLPEFFSGLGIEAGNTFLKIRAFAEITHDINFAVGYDGRGLARKIGDP